MDNFLVVDMQRVMVESTYGRLLSRTIDTEREEAVSVHAGREAQLRDQRSALTQEARRFDDELRAIEHKRREMNARARAEVSRVATEIATARGADTVIDAGAVLLCPEGRDITDEVIAQLDNEGPHRPR